ncbi:hypothetical protein SK128_010915 [Halocaridina rubra]|uniref:Apple domain-containing protein n=1 Tax=Halocaridina rubra TaxID=373956 RepID=A0AAN9A2R4_HALRR
MCPIKREEINRVVVFSFSLIDIPTYKLFGWDYATTDEGQVDNFIYGPSALLRMTYSNASVIRGIDADHWVLSHPDGYVIDYFFAIDQWTMPYGHKLAGIDLKAPLRIQVYGLEGNPWDSGVQQFNQEVYYDFLEFKPYVSPADWKTFLVRHGVDCRGRMSLDSKENTPPTAPENFKVYMETITRRVNHTDGTVFRSWLYFDAFRKAMRLDVNPTYDANAGKAYKSIQDLGTGIEYYIDKKTGECTIRPWKRDDLGTLIGVEIADIIFADPNKLFYLDEAYIFNGISETRSLMTSRWTSTRTDIKNPDGGNYKKVIVDYEFLADVMGDGSEFRTLGTPVKIDITIYQDSDSNSVQETQTVNLLSIDSAFEAYEINPFDVRECSTLPTQRSWLKIHFLGDWTQGAEQNQDLFKKQIMEKIYSGTKTSYVRMSEITFDHIEMRVMATILLLEPSPYHLQFVQQQDAKPSTVDSQIPFPINDVDSCAAFCLAYKNFDCRQYYECSGQGRNCYVSNWNQPKPPFVDVPPCQRFTKALTSSDFQQPNGVLYAWLLNETAYHQFTFTLVYTDWDGSEKEGVFDGFRVDNEVYGNDPIFVDYLRSDFHLARNHAKLKATFNQLTLQGGSYIECLLACDMTLSFTCQTFSYCYNSQNCYLSDYVGSTPVDQNDVVTQQDCVVVGRRYTDSYNVIEGTVYTSDAQQTITEVKDPDKCAFLCDNSTDFTCRSFDYCLDTHICDLYTERSIDIPSELLNHSVPMCLHFERNALVDFVRHDNQVLAGSRDRFLQGVTASYCAEICEQEPDYGCNGFDYCKEGGIINCFLTQDHYSDDGVVISNSPTCSHYSREYYDGKDRNSFAHSKKSKYKYGPGDMAGLGVSMLVISIAMTFAGVYIYNKNFK